MMFDGRVAEPHRNEKCTLGLRARDQYANKFILLGASAYRERERERDAANPGRIKVKYLHHALWECVLDVQPHCCHFADTSSHPTKSITRP